MSLILIAGLVLVCIALFYFFDIFGVKKWADKTFGKKAANKFVSNANRPPVGSAVLCSKGDPMHNGGVYRVMPNGIAWYPSVDVADSWDRNWRSTVNIDCTGERLLPEMKNKWAHDDWDQRDSRQYGNRDPRQYGNRDRKPLFEHDDSDFMWDEPPNPPKPRAPKVIGRCEPGEILSQKLKNGKVGNLVRVYECHDKTGKLMSSAELGIPGKPSGKPSGNPSDRLNSVRTSTPYNQIRNPLHHNPND